MRFLLNILNASWARFQHASTSMYTFVYHESSWNMWNGVGESIHFNWANNLLIKWKKEIKRFKCRYLLGFRLITHCCLLLSLAFSLSLPLDTVFANLLQFVHHFSALFAKASLPQLRRLCTASIIQANQIKNFFHFLQMQSKAAANKQRTCRQCNSVTAGNAVHYTYVTVATKAEWDGSDSGDRQRWRAHRRGDHSTGFCECQS